jgi:hypothetical protein
MKISVPKLFQRYSKHESVEDSSEYTVASVEPANTGDTKKPQKQTQAQVEEEEPLMLTVEEIQAPLNTLPKMTSPDALGCVCVRK